MADQLLLVRRPEPARRAPEAMISVRVSIHSPSTLRRNGRFERSASITVPCRYSAPKCSACFLHVLDQVRAVDAFGKSGKVLDQRSERELAAGFMAVDHQRFQIGAGRVDGGRVSGAAGANDYNISHR